MNENGKKIYKLFYNVVDLFFYIKIYEHNWHLMDDDYLK